MSDGTMRGPRSRVSPAADSLKALGAGAAPEGVAVGKAEAAGAAEGMAGGASDGVSIRGGNILISAWLPEIKV